MSYATLLVHLSPGHAKTRLLNVARALAERFSASVIGVAACQPMMLDYGVGFTSEALVEADRETIEKTFRKRKKSFEALFNLGPRLLSGAPSSLMVRWRITLPLKRGAPIWC